MAQSKRITRIYQKRAKVRPREVFDKLKSLAFTHPHANARPGGLLKYLTEEERRVLRGLTSDETQKERAE